MMPSYLRGSYKGNTKNVVVSRHEERFETRVRVPYLPQRNSHVFFIGLLIQVIRISLCGGYTS